MDWTAAQQTDYERELTRIGIRKGERMPYPNDPRASEPAQFLALLRGIPDGAGLAGYLTALRQHSSSTG